MFQWKEPSPKREGPLIRGERMNHHNLKSQGKGSAKKKSPLGLKNGDWPNPGLNLPKNNWEE